MKKGLSLVFLLVLASVSSSLFVSAVEGSIIITVDSGNMGAVVRVLDPDTEERIDDGVNTKNYGTGVVSVEYETILSEVSFLILLTRDGSVVGKKTVGPFFTAEPLELDCRTGKGCSEVVEVVEEIPSVASNQDPSNNTNNTNNTGSVAAPVGNVPSSESNTVSEESSPGEGSAPVTGNVVQSGLSTTGRWYIVAGIVALLSMFTMTGVFLHRRKKRSALVNLARQTPSKPAAAIASNPEEQELADIERRMKENESRIQSIKKRQETRKKLQDAKQRLLQEENELRKLQDGEGLGSANKNNRMWGIR